MKIAAAILALVLAAGAAYADGMSNTSNMANTSGMANTSSMSGHMNADHKKMMKKKHNAMKGSMDSSKASSTGSMNGMGHAESSTSSGSMGH